MALAIEKMVASLLGWTPEQMEGFANQALGILEKLGERVESIERNAAEANERLKRLEEKAGISAPLQFIENHTGQQEENSDGKEAAE